MELIDIFGYLASICMILGYLPQAITTIRTRDTDGIAMMTFSMMGLGSLFFIFNGILMGEKGIPLAITNIITFICAAIIFSIKVYNDTHKTKNK